MVVLARLLTPEEFGLVGMVTAFTGFLALFRDVGLSMATVQRPSITHEQTSTLFWINTVAGATLAALCVGAAPIVARFYHEPRLLGVMVMAGLGFIFYGATAQHRALLQRYMRFDAIVLVDFTALMVSTAAGIGAALLGWGYWALVVMAVCAPAMTTVGVWLACGWVPGAPRRRVGVRSMMQYGSVITLNSLIVYLAYNVDKVLLGRFWGADVLGVYGRAYQLISIPTENLNSVVGSVMFPALSRVQDDAARFRNYFLRGYALFLALVLPITVACALFAEDIVRVLLGPQWNGAVPVFRALSPTILAFALINPLAWLMQACGRAMRSLYVAFLIAPVVILGYVLGLARGPVGVAIGFSAAMVILVVPVVGWAKHGTAVSGRDVLRTAIQPAASVGIAGAVAAAISLRLVDGWSPLARLCVLSAVLFGVYATVLLFVFRQRGEYLELLRASGVWSRGKPEASCGGAGK